MSSFSPLQLKQIFFVNVCIKSNWELDAGGVLMTNVEFKGKVHQNNNRDWMLNVRVIIKSANEKPIPYEGTIECVGTFSVAPQWPDDQIEKLVMVNGTGIIYGCIREMLCTITARGPFGIIMLPSQSFLESFEQTKRASFTGTATASAQ